MQAEGYCPYCGEPIALWVDEGGARHQRYTEDCAVCCRPIDVDLTTFQDSDSDSVQPLLSLRRSDE